MLALHIWRAVAERSNVQNVQKFRFETSQLRLLSVVLSVWPDVWLKNCPKVGKAVFTWSVMFLNCPKSHFTFGILLKNKICHQKLSKIWLHCFLSFLLYAWTKRWKLFCCHFLRLQCDQMTRLFFKIWPFSV